MYLIHYFIQHIKLIHIIEWLYKAEYLQDERKDNLIIEREFINNFTGGIQILEIYKHLDYNQLKFLYEYYKARYYGGCDYPVAPIITF